MTKPRPRNIANDILDCVETATAKWTRQKKSEERHPGNIRYRVSRMTREPRTTQKEAAWSSAGSGLYGRERRRHLAGAWRGKSIYQARPKIMAMTDDKELQYGYFSQTLLPDYIEEHGVDWNVVYDARGHFEEPHTNRRIGCGTIEVRNYLNAAKEPDIVPADFAGASVDVIGPSGSLSAILFCEKEGFSPLFKAVNLANRYDLMIVSTKGVSVTAARRLIDDRLRRSRPAVVRAARFRHRRVPDPRHASARHPALPVFKRRRGDRSRTPACRHRRPRARAGRRDQDQREHPARQLAENGARARRSTSCSTSASSSTP